MIRYFNLFLLIAAACLPGLAQEPVKTGVKGGININTVRYRHSDPNSATLGFNIGLLTRIQIVEGIYLQPEFLFSQKGYRSPVVGANGAVNSRMNYINLPILATFEVGKNFFLYTGPEFGYLVKASNKQDNSSFNMTDYYNKFDWGLDAGAAYQFAGNLGVELRYFYGFRGLVKGITTDENGVPNGSNRDGANRVFQAGLFYIF